MSFMIRIFLSHLSTSPIVIAVAKTGKQCAQQHMKKYLPTSYIRPTRCKSAAFKNKKTTKKHNTRIEFCVYAAEPSVFIRLHCL